MRVNFVEIETRFFGFISEFNSESSTVGSIAKRIFSFTEESCFRPVCCKGTIRFSELLNDERDIREGNLCASEER